MHINIYTLEEIYKTYENIEDHLSTRQIIRRFSQNKNDIRVLTLEHCNLKHCKNILDLGCGYGFFTEALSNRINPQAHITGIDVIGGENKKMFLSTCAQSGYTATFIEDSANVITEFPDASYDCIIASYSLYFFPQLIEDIARILKNDGTFIVLTHSENTLEQITKLFMESIHHIIMEGDSSLHIVKLFQAFSAENGFTKLQPHFDHITYIRYPNNLIFKSHDINHCISYIQKKQYLFFKDIASLDVDEYNALIEDFYNRLRWHASSYSQFVVNKDDAIFIANTPRRKETTS
ncbi:MAG: class I SAM-dependent methyltransferase [Spirochaetes bacterium]|nr:class I SAM-dependent methyltransferase [Spirochaetota bacterium]